MKDSLTKEQFYPQPIAQVWDAISKAEKISTWFIKAQFEAREGAAYTFTHEETVITGKVLKVNPVNELVYTWILGGTEAETTVSWQLTEKDGGTLLTLVHSGISNYPDEQTAVTMAGHFEQGWARCTGDLAEYLKKEPANA